MIRTNATLAASVSEYDNDGAIPRAANEDAPAIALESVLDAVDSERAKYRRQSPQTEQAYRKARRNFCKWAAAHGICTISQITVEALNAYVTDLQRANMGASTIELYSGHVRRLALDAGALGRAASIDGRLIKWQVRREPAAKTHSRQALTPEEVARVLAAAEAAGLRALAVVHLALCGLRTAEVGGLRVGDIDAAGCRVRITGKGRTAPEWVDIPAPTVAILRGYIANRWGGEAYVDPVHAACAGESLWGASTAHWVYTTLRGLLDAAGISRAGIVPHSFRHTAATFLLANGAPLAQVSRYLRHAEPRTTMRYAHDLDSAATAARLTTLVTGVQPARQKEGEDRR